MRVQFLFYRYLQGRFPSPASFSKTREDAFIRSVLFFLNIIIWRMIWVATSSDFNVCSSQRVTLNGLRRIAETWQ